MQENLHTLVQVVTMSNSPLTALYQSLHNVFSPLLLRDGSGGADKRLQALMSELDNSLEKTLRMQGLQCVCVCVFVCVCVCACVCEFPHLRDEKAVPTPGACAHAL